MSIDNPAIVDAVTVRDGFTVLTIFQLGPWPGPSTALGLLDEKLGFYFEHIESAAHLSLHSSRPHAIELVCIEPPPHEVAQLCRRAGVVIRCRETRTDA